MLCFFPNAPPLLLHPPLQPSALRRSTFSDNAALPAELPRLSSLLVAVDGHAEPLHHLHPCSASRALPPCWPSAAALAIRCH